MIRNIFLELYIYIYTGFQCEQISRLYITIIKNDAPLACILFIIQPMFTALLSYIVLCKK